LKIKNPGTAPAQQVRVAAWLPLGVKLQENGGARYNPQDRMLLWKLPQLEEGGEATYTFQVLMGGPRIYRVRAAAVASGELREDKECATEVTGHADVELTVAERRKVIDVGEDTTYEIRIVNRGTKEARKLLVSADLSNQLKWVKANSTEPEPAQGDQTGHHVEFPVIDQLAAQDEKILTIQVKAQAAGNATCQVTLTHDDLGQAKLQHTTSTRVTDAGVGK
jgi:hypothetical protein